VAVLIDTSLLVAFERGDLPPDIVTEDSAISVITVSEILHGVHRASGAERVQRHAAAEHLLDQYETIDVTESTARVHALVSSDLARAGTPVGDHDLWIGATALTHGLGVMTRDTGDFARIPGLRVVVV
jgi:predicted nucleic acid-binding protein